MIRISVKIDNILNRKIKAFPSAENSNLYHIEVDRKRVNRAGQTKSLYTIEEVLELVSEYLGCSENEQVVEPEPGKKLPVNTPVIIKAFDEDLMPRRRKTWTKSEPFLDWKGDWRVLVLGESKPVKVDDLEVAA